MKTLTSNHEIPGGSFSRQGLLSMPDPSITTYTITRGDQIASLLDTGRVSDYIREIMIWTQAFIIIILHSGKGPVLTCAQALPPCAACRPLNIAAGPRPTAA